MAGKLQLLTALILFSAVLSEAGKEAFKVQGKVYCDNCRAGFETTVTKYISGATVRFTCMNETTHEILETVEGKTDASGTYDLKVMNDHQDELCEVTLVSSPMKDCTEIVGGRDKAQVEVTDNSGIPSKIRYANSLGFYRKDPLPLCGKLLAEYDLADDDE